MIKFRWWREHQRITPSGYLASVRGHYKGLKDYPIEIQHRFKFAKVVATKGGSWARQYKQFDSRCPECNELVDYYHDNKNGNAWFDQVGRTWQTHGCMAKVVSKCTPEFVPIIPDADTIRLNRIKFSASRLLREKALEARNEIRRSQNLTPIKLNGYCRECSKKTYLFKSCFGFELHLDTLYPDWIVHRCWNKYNKESYVKHEVKLEERESQRANMLNAVSENELTCEAHFLCAPQLYSNVDEHEFAEVSTVLCRIPNITSDRGGHRLRLIPVALPKVNIVLFTTCPVYHLQGIEFGYLKEKVLTVFSMYSLSPMEVEVEYITVNQN